MSIKGLLASRNNDDLFDLCLGEYISQNCRESLDLILEDDVTFPVSKMPGVGGFDRHKYLLPLEFLYKGETQDGT